VVAGFGSLMEVRKEWDLDALCDAHEVLDLREDAEQQALQEAQRPQRGR